MRRDPQLVILDCDGVLVDSEVISNRVLAEMLSAEGLPTTLRQARRDYQGLLLADILSRAQDKLGHPLPEGWLDRYETERAAAFRRELSPVAGAVEAVQRVTAAGIGVCVASQGKFPKTRLRSVGYAADSDERALRDAGAAEILRSLDELPRILGLD